MYLLRPGHIGAAKDDMLNFVEDAAAGLERAGLRISSEVVEVGLK